MRYKLKEKYPQSNLIAIKQECERAGEPYTIGYIGNRLSCVIGKEIKATDLVGVEEEQKGGKKKKKNGIYERQVRREIHWYRMVQRGVPKMGSVKVYQVERKM